MSYTFLDASGSVQSAFSSVIGGVNLPTVQISGGIPLSGAVSVSGTVGASIIGTVPVIVTNTPSISGTVNIAGNPSISGQVGASIIGSVPVTIANVSVSGTVGASVIGTVPVVQSGIFITSITGIPSISGTVNIAGNPSVSGQVGASVIGLTPVNIVGAPSVYGNVSGSVVAFQGAGWSGSIAAFQAGTQITSVSGTVTVASIVATYAEDAGHNSGDPGIFVLAVRNDTMASIQSADLDYSPMAVGPSGENIVANAPLTKWVQGNASILTGTPLNGGSVQVIAAGGSSIFTYITAVQVANASPNNVYLTFFGATSSIVGYLPVPANGGAVPTFPNGWKTNANGAFYASISGSASVFISAEGFISKT